MRRGLWWVLVVWMSILTVWTATLACSGTRPVEAVAHDDVPRILDVRDLVVVRYETLEHGVATQIAAPRTMPLWEYVEGGDRETRQRLNDLMTTLEQDLHAKDSRFHLTHELIDGREW